MKKKETIPSAFESAFGSLGYGNAEGATEVTDMNNLDSTIDVELNNTTEEKPVDTTEVKEPESTAKEDTTQIPDEVLKQMNNTDQVDTVDETPNAEEVTQADVLEAQNVGVFFDAFAESLGWDVSEINEDERPVTMDGLTDYIKAVVDQNSVPTYADERIQALDEYVKRGGRFEDFYAAQQQQLNYDNIDLQDEANQRTVIREFLHSSGYTDEQIKNKIDRYESVDMLEEEAEDALSRLKVIKQLETAKLQQQQEAARIQQEEQNKAFFTDVSNQIKNLTSIHGVTVPQEDRKALFDYIFKQDANGMSQYQKDFNKNLGKNLIESAYFTMRADSFVTEAKKAGQTTAAQKLRQMLRHSSKNHTTFNADEDKQRPAWEIASKFL